MRLLGVQNVLVSQPKKVPRQRRGDAVIDRVLDVALKELARVGLERLSLPAVAQKAGVNKTSVYRRWPTKAKLVRAALERSMQHTRAAPDSGSLHGDLIELASVVARFIESPSGMGVLRTVFADGHTSQVKSLTSSMWSAGIGGAPAQIIERAMTRGELAPTAEVELLLFTIAGALLHRVFIERGEVDRAYLERLVTLVTRGV